MTPARPTWPADVWALEGDAARERKRLAERCRVTLALHVLSEGGKRDERNRTIAAAVADRLASSRPAESAIAARNEGARD